MKIKVIIFVGLLSSAVKEDNVEIYPLENYTFIQVKKQSILDLWKIYPLTVLENATTATVQCRNAYDNYLRRLHNNDLNATKSEYLFVKCLMTI